MNYQFSALTEAIEFSPLLEDEQKVLLITAIEESEEFTPELIEAIFGFVSATLEMENFAEEVLADELADIEKQIQQINQEDDELSEEEVQERAKKIIFLVDNFIAEKKKMETDYDQEVENLVKTEVDQDKIQVIRDKLNLK